MGQDKASLIFGGETMLARAIRVMHEVAHEVIVVGRPDHNPFFVHRSATREGGRGLPVRITHDPVEDLGPLAGIAAGLAASTTDLNIVVACDMPLIKPAVLRRLCALRGDADICVAVVDKHVSPLCAVYRARVAGVASELLASGERRVMALLDRVPTTRVDATAFGDIDPHLDSFISCDTPAAYQQALIRLKADATSG